MQKTADLLCNATLQDWNYLTHIKTSLEKEEQTCRLQGDHLNSDVYVS